jgi:hypothetical protein
MNSEQLNTLCKLARLISADLSGVVDCIIESHHYDEDDTSQRSTQVINHIIDGFNANLLLIFVYIIPIVPNSISSPNDLHNSLVAWYDLF